MSTPSTPVPFDLVLFTTDPGIVRRAEQAGVDGFFIDWEHHQKRTRQSGFDTQINADTYDDLCRVRAAAAGKVLCRINRFDGSARSREEVELAIEGGADEILLPMAESAAEIEPVLSLAAGRAGVGLILETAGACADAKAIGALPLSRVYIGLNDLNIQRRTSSIFTPLFDGTLERVREHISVPFGLLGLTNPACGSPIPCELFIAEMVRFRCRFTLLRRSFHRDCPPERYGEEIPRIIGAVQEAFELSDEEVTARHNEFHRRVHALAPQAPSAGEAA